MRSMTPFSSAFIADFEQVNVKHQKEVDDTFF